MSFKATERPMSGGGGFKQEPLDPGTYPARMVGVAIVGLHAGSYNGEPKPPMENLCITYELLDEYMADEEGNIDESKPRFMSEMFPFHNLAADRATSTKRYLALDPLHEFDGDWSRLLGIPCVVTLKSKAGKGQHTGKTFNNIDGVSIMRAKEAAKAPEPVNEPLMFDFNEPDKEAWTKANGYVKYQVRKALNYGGSPMEAWDKEAKEEAPAEPEKPAAKSVKAPAGKQDW